MVKPLDNLNWQSWKELNAARKHNRDCKSQLKWIHLPDCFGILLRTSKDGTWSLLETQVFQHREQPVPHLSQDYPTYPTCSSCNLCILWCTSPNSRTLGGNSAWVSKYTVSHCFSCRLSLIRLLSNFHITCKSEIQHSDIRQRETQEPCGIWWTQPHDAKSGTIGDIRGCHRMHFLLLDILDSPDLSSPVMSCAWGLPSYNLTLHEYGQNSPTHFGSGPQQALEALSSLLPPRAGYRAQTITSPDTETRKTFIYSFLQPCVLNPIFAKNWNGLKWDVSGKVTSGQSTKAHLCICILKRDWIALSSCPASWIPNMMNLNSHWPKKLCMPIACKIQMMYWCIWGLSKIMLPENCPYATLSRIFRALSRPSRIGTWDYDPVFVYIFIGYRFINWLVILTTLKNISQWEGLSHILWKIKNVWNHQPV